MRFSLNRCLPDRFSRWGIAAVAVFALALPATAQAGGFSAHLYAPNHQPKARKLWPIKVTATRGRQKLSGSVYYRFFYNGTLVSRKRGGKFRHGVWRDTLLWPERAVGPTLRLQVVVSTRYGTDYLDWWIKVRR